MSAAVFWVFAGAMELSWLYAWATFTLFTIEKKLYPLPSAIAIFALAAVTTALVRGRGWRIIQIIFVHLMGWAALTLEAIHRLWYPSTNLFCLDWLADFANRPLGPYEWFVLILFGIWTIVFWIRGLKFACRSASFSVTVTQFDKGLTWLFALLIIKLLIRAQTDIELQDPVSDTLIFPFFIFGPPALALSRGRIAEGETFMTGYRGIGLTISFTVVVFFLGTGLALLFTPYLRFVSQAGYAALKTSAQFLEPFVAKFFMFAFGYKPRPAATPESALSGPVADTLPISPTPWWMELFLKIFIWVFWILLALVLIVLLGIGTWYLWRWLFSRTPKTATGRTDLWFVPRWLKHWMASLQRLYKKILGNRQSPEAIRLYKSLLKWGQRSGLTNQLNETPLEYGRRLQRHFSTLATDIRAVIELFNLYIYGEKAGSGIELARARRAMQRLQSPKLWPRRLKLWFLNGK